jgi:hypothetical protein
VTTRPAIQAYAERVRDAVSAFEGIAAAISAEIEVPAHRVSIAYSDDGEPCTDDDPPHVWTVTIGFVRARSRKRHIGHVAGHGPTIEAAVDDAIAGYWHTVETEGVADVTPEIRVRAKAEVAARYS